MNVPGCSSVQPSHAVHRPLVSFPHILLTHLGGAGCYQCRINLSFTINSLKIINIRPRTLCTLFETSHHQLDSIPPLRLIQPLMCVQGNLTGHVHCATNLSAGRRTRHRSAFVRKCEHLSSQGLCEHKDVSHYCAVWDDELVRLQYYWLEKKLHQR